MLKGEKSDEDKDKEGEALEVKEKWVCGAQCLLGGLRHEMCQDRSRRPVTSELYVQIQLNITLNLYYNIYLSF